MEMIILQTPPAAEATSEETVIIDDQSSAVNNILQSPDSNSNIVRKLPLTTPAAEAGSEPSVESKAASSGDDFCRPFDDRHFYRITEPSMHRLVSSDGSSNVYWNGVDGRLRKYVADAMTSLAQLPLYYHVLAFMAALFISWTLFALLWWLIAATNGDLISEDEYSTVERRSDAMCTHHVYDFASALLYSVEAQTTLGYGTRVTNPACVPSLTLLIIQLVVGLAIDCVIAGLVFDKLTRPRRRSQMTRFARRAVIFRRPDDGSYCLAIRVWYDGHSPLLSATVRVVYVSGGANVTSDDGFRGSININLESGFAIFPWPETVVHRIDSYSPLWNVSADNLYKLDFELIVIVDGTVESTGIGCQYMTSYKPSDIMWGHVFAPLTLRRQKNTSACDRSLLRRISRERRLVTSAKSRWYVDCSRFDEIDKCDTMPRYCAKEATRSIETD